METPLFLNTVWSTQLKPDRRALHNVRIELHRCKGRRTRDSIQILLPADATVEVLSQKCLESNEATISPGYVPTTNSYCVDLPKLFGENPPDDLTLEVSLTEKGSVSKIRKADVNHKANEY